MSTVIFCEDAPHIRKLIAISMRTTQHRVLIADDGDAGLQLIRAERPDLVVTDLAMPVLDGIELFDSLRADPNLAHIPIVFLTASTQPSLVAAARARQPEALLGKPFSTAELRQTVDAVLARLPVAGAGA